MFPSNKNQVIGPKPNFSTPLQAYQNKETDNLQCYDDFNSKIIQLSSYSILGTPSNKPTNKNTRKVKFNLNIVHCQFNQKDPVLAIGKLVQKLIHSKPHLGWVNPKFTMIQI